MKEYFIGEDGREFAPSMLESERMPKDIYVEVCKGLVISCHDIIVEHNGGALLVKRREHPAKGLLWPIGGRMLRGVPLEESIKRKVREECGLDVEDVKYLDCQRIGFQTSCFEHGKGTDAIGLWYFGKGRGELRLNELHEAPTIVKPEEYTPEFRDRLHPYVQDFLDLTIPLIKDNRRGKNVN